MTSTPATPPGPRGSGRVRPVLAGIALVLASVSLVLLSVAGWVHQVVLNTDRFTSVVADVSSDPVVTDAVAHRLSVEVVDALEVADRLEGRLPDAAKPLAPTLTLAIQDALDQRLRTAFQEPRLHDAWVRAISTTHRAMVALLRDEADAAVVADGYVYFDALALVGPALDQLQTAGIIPADVTLPDLTAGETADALRSKLETALGASLPADFGLVKLMPADRLLAARTAVKAFDLLVVLLAVVTIAFALAALWLARRRRRMLAFLGVGAVIALVITRLVIRGLTSLIASGIADPDASAVMKTVLDTAIGDLVAFTTWLVVGGAALAIIAYLAGRPRWATSLVETGRAAVGQAGAAAGQVGAGVAAAAPGGATLRAPDGLNAAIRRNRAQLERLGIALIAFLVAWVALGIEIAVIGAALVIVFELALALASGEDEAPDVAPGPGAEASADGSPGSGR